MASVAAAIGRHTRRALGLPPDGWALWRQATGGDPGAAHALVGWLTPAALALARQMLGRLEDAEDVVQESFLRLWSAQADDTHGAQLSTYFHTIVLNRCRTHLLRTRELSLDPADLAELHERQQMAHDQPVAIDAAGVQAALHALPARQRMALAMWAYADADVADIGRALEIDTNAAHQLLFRAKRSLRNALQEHPT
jgi:RNA polymerase sigma-70 factor (ECF subfamily)